MKITRRQLRRIISEEVSSSLEEQGCADREGGCVREDEDGTWYILNNKKGGTWRKGFKSKQSALDTIEAMHSQGK